MLDWFRYWALSPHPLVIVSLFFNGSLAVFFFCFVLFSDQLTLCVSDKVCTAFAATMYYFLLSTMIWTVCRAALVYKRYVVVFDTGERSDTFTFNRMATLISIGLSLKLIYLESETYRPSF